MSLTKIRAALQEESKHIVTFLLKYATPYILQRPILSSLESHLEANGWQVHYLKQSEIRLELMNEVISRNPLLDNKEAHDLTQKEVRTRFEALITSTVMKLQPKSNKTLVIIEKNCPG